MSPLLEAPQRAPAPACRTGGHQQAGHEHPRAVSLAIVSPVRHSPCTARTLCPLCRPRTTPSPPRRPSRLRLSRPTRSACWCSPPRGGTWAGAAARMAQQVGVGRASGGECGAAAGRVLCAVRCALRHLTAGAVRVPRLRGAPCGAGCAKHLRPPLPWRTPSSPRSAPLPHLARAPPLSHAQAHPGRTPRCQSTSPPRASCWGNPSLRRRRRQLARGSRSPRPQSPSASGPKARRPTRRPERLPPCRAACFVFCDCLVILH